jgi:hypothetical protein
MLLELEVEYAELESVSLAPTIARALPRLSFFLDRHSSLCLFLCLLLWSCLDRYLPSILDYVLVAILVLDLLRAVGDEVSGLPHWKHVLVLLLMFTRFSCSLSNHLVRSASSSYPSTSNSSSGIDIKEDKENILVDG